MQKRIISMFLCLCLLIGLFPLNVFADTITVRAGVKDSSKASNFDVWGVGSAGNEIQTSHAWQGYWTEFKVDGTTVSIPRMTTTNNNGVQIQTSVKIISNNSFAQIKYTVTNNTSSYRSVGIATHTDTNINGVDAAPIQGMSDGRGIVMMDGKGTQFQLLLKNAYGVTNVDNWWYGQYSQRTSHHWDGNTSQTALWTGDSGLTFGWNNRSIAPYTTQEFSVNLGVGTLNSPPTLNASITNQKSSYYPNETISFSGTVNDTDSGDSVSIRWGMDNGGENNVSGGPWYPNGTPRSFSGSFQLPSVMSPGNHFVQIWAIDSAGNMSMPITINFTVTNDTTAPTLTLAQSPTAWTLGNVTITANALDTESNVVSITKPDGTVQSFSAQNASLNYTVSANGTYVFKAKDSFGNEKTTNIVISNIDRTPPSLLVDNPPAWSNSDVVLGVTASDTQSGLKTVTYTTNEGTPQTGTTTNGGTITLRNEGIYNLTVDAFDNLNQKTSLTKTVKIDKVKPIINGHSLTELGPLARSVITNKSMKITINTSDVLSGFRNLEYKLTGDSTYTRLADGVVEFTIAKPYSGPISIYAYDNAGNKSEEYIINELIMENTSPVLAVDTPPAWSTVDLDLNVTATDDNGIQSITYSTNEASPQSGTVSSGGKIHLIHEGRYILTVIATDTAGNQTTITRNVNIDKTRPSIDSHTITDLVPLPSQKGRSVVVDNHPTVSSVELKIGASDTLSGVNRVEYKLSDEDSYKTATISNGFYYFRIEKAYSGPISIYSFDNAGNKSEEYIIEGLKMGNSPPVIEITNNSDWQTGSPVSFPVKIYDSMGIMNIVQADFKTAESSPTTGSLRHESSNQYFVDLNNEGVYTFEVHAKNEAGAESYAKSEVVKIDKTKPLINRHVITELDKLIDPISPFFLKTQYTNKIVRVEFDVTDNLSGFDYLKYKLPGETDYTVLPRGENSFVITKDIAGTISIYAYDVATNESLEYTISDLVIDSKKPEIEVDVSSDWTNESVIATITAKDNFGFNNMDWFTTESPDNPDFQSGTFDMTSWLGTQTIELRNEGVYTLLVSGTDLSGNTTSVESAVIKIDKTKPEITKFEYYLPQPNFLELPLPEEPVIPEVLPEEIEPDETPIPEPLPEEPTSQPEDVPAPPSDSVQPEATPPVQPSTPPTEGIDDGTLSEEDVEEFVTNDIALASLPENIFGTDIWVQVFPRDIMGRAQSGVQSVEYALTPDDWMELSPDADGNYIFSLTENFNGTIYARCTDVAGNVSDVYSEDVILDKDSPNPTLIIHSPDIWNVVPGVIDIAVQDTNGLASVYYTQECIEGNGSNEAYELLDSEAPTSFSTEIEIPEDGIYSITVVAEDIAGNSTTRTANIKVDRTAPNINKVTFSSIDADGNIIEEDCTVTNKKLLVSVEVDDALSKFEHLEYMSVDSNSWKPVIQEGKEFYITTAYMGNVKLRAFDYAGNVSSIYISEEVIIETEGPDLNSSYNNDWTSGDVTFNIHAEDVLSKVSSIIYFYTLPNGDEIKGEIPIESNFIVDTTFTATEHGEYSVTFIAFDVAGNASTITRTVKIDKTPSLKAPNVNSNGYISGTWYEKEVSLEALYDSEDIPLSGISKYQYKEVGTENWIDGILDVNEFTDTAYVFRAITTVGLISEETQPFSVKIDKNKPIIKENAIKDNTKFSEKIVITVEVIEEESGLNYIEYKTDASDWTRIPENVISFTEQYSGNIQIRAVDICGNVSDVYEIKNLTIDFDRPTLKLISSLNTKDIIELEADEIVKKGNIGYLRIIDPKAESYMVPIAELFITNNRIKVDGTKVYVNVAGIIDGRKEYKIEVDEGFVKDMAGNISYAMEGSTLNTSSSKWPSMIGVNIKDISGNIYTGVLDSNSNEYNIIIPRNLLGDVVLTPEWDLKVNEIAVDSTDVVIKEVTPINAKFTIDNDYSFPISLNVQAYSTKVKVNIYRGDIAVKLESDNKLNAQIDTIDILKAIDFKSILESNSDDTSFEVIVSLEYNPKFVDEVEVAKEKVQRIQNLEDISEPIDINVKYFEIKDGIKGEAINISELQNPLKITIDLPSQFSNKDAYNVIRIHDGKLSVLPATRSGNKLTFQSDKFSVYFIAVGDEIEYYVPPVVKRDWDEDMPKDTWCVVPALIDNDNVVAKFSFIDKDNYMEFLKPVAGNYHLIVNHKDFNDVNWNWNYEAVHSLAARNIISGYSDGTFRPNNNITRAEFVSLIARLENLPVNNYHSSSFKDVNKNDWFSKNLEAVYDIGLVDGIGNGNFAPNRPITRQEMAKILYNYLKYKGKDNLYTDMAGKSFYDNTKISSWAIDGVRILSSIGIIGGYNDNTFGPHKNATRAETSQMLWRLVVYVVENSKDNHLITSYSEVNGK